MNAETLVLDSASTLADAKPLTLLAVDDDPGDLALLRRHLEDIQGWRVRLLAVEDWAEAEAVLNREEVNAILLDFHLKDFNGLDLLRRLRHAGEQRPIILLTGQGDEAIAAEAMRDGADDYLNKRWLGSDALRRALSGALERSRLRADMALLAEELRQAQRMEAIATLAGGLAHDFNNLLTGAMGYLEMALEREPNPEIAEDLLRVRRICEQMAETVRHLLAFGRGASLDFVEVNLPSLLEAFRAVLIHTLPEGVQLRWEVHPLPLLLQAVPAQLHQVLMGITRNAIEAMAGRGTLTLRARRVQVDEAFAHGHPGLRPGDHALVEIEDTGRGMDVETRRRIFDPFFTTKGLDASKGRGASLALAWQAVRAHRGTILVESEPSQGARFSLYLPLKSLEAPPPPGGTARSGRPRGKETLLFVDDEASLADVAQSFLERLGYRVFTAGDGVAALEIIEGRGGEIDLVVLDLSMPRMDGKTCYLRLREAHPDLPVVFASGHDMAAVAPELLAMGAKGVLQKPFLLRDLATEVRRVLDARGASIQG